jgi:uncharacterized protein YwqG
MSTRDKILAVMRANGVDDLADSIMPLVQPAIFIRATKLASALPTGASRFGGIPDLPPGTAWPARENVPMEFIAQIRIADLSGMDPDGKLPARGSLLFFSSSQHAFTDYQGGVCGAVLWHDGDDAALVRTPAPRVNFKGEYDSEPRVAPYVYGLAQLAFEPYVMVPVAPSAFIPSDFSDRWQDFMATYGDELEPEASHSFASNHLLGYLGDQDYVDAQTTDDQMLLQVDSDSAASFSFGDVNRLYFVLTRAELAARDFSKVRLYSSLG